MANLIPRQLIFGNPERASVRISPDGEQLAWLAPSNGVLNVWVSPRENLEEARPVTSDPTRGIRTFTWAYTANHIIYAQDKAGDENWRLFAVNLTTGQDRDLTPIEGIQARIEQMSSNYPNEILVGINDRDPQWHDVYRLDITTGERTRIYENSRFAQIIADDSYELREGYEMTEDGGVAIYRPVGRDATEWIHADSIGPADSSTTEPIGFDTGGETLSMKDSRGRDTAAVYAVDYESGDRTLLAEDARADAEGVIQHPVTRKVQAVSFVYERKEWKIVDAAIEQHLALLSRETRGEVEVLSRTLDDLFWVVAFEPDNGPVSYYLYDTDAQSTRKLFTNRPALEDQPLVPMHPATIKTRDGLDMVIYLSLPAGSDSDGDNVPDSPLPLVLLPHGGPWARDSWGYDAMHQWLANRGYAALSVNFRSSVGFGKAFTNAGDREWGGKILEDQIDAVEWAKKQRIAAPDRVAIAGGSFGGYSTLAGLTMYPQTYACGVDIVGPSNLITLLESVPEYWKPMLNMLTSRVGDHRTEAGRALLKKHSPLSYVERIARPLLIGQGANDPRVKQAESDQIVSAMQEKSIPVTYVLYSDEGHGFARPENRLSFFAIMEAFLARHLGGSVEPIGDDLANSSLKVSAGADEIPGLAD